MPKLCVCPRITAKYGMSREFIFFINNNLISDSNYARSFEVMIFQNILFLTVRNCDMKNKCFFFNLVERMKSDPCFSYDQLCWMFRSENIIYIFVKDKMIDWFYFLMTYQLVYGYFMPRHWRIIFIMHSYLHSCFLKGFFFFFCKLS